MIAVTRVVTNGNVAINDASKVILELNNLRAGKP
jgi:hypothetical protein